MSLKRIARKILPVAKVLGTALGGPAGPLVSMALAAVGGALGVEPTKPAIEQALKNDPEALVKLKQAELTFDARMAELDVDVFKIAAEDRDSARTMAVKTSLWPQIILSGVFLVGIFYILIGLISGSMSIQESIKDIVILIIGMFIREIPTIMQFWFGSSAGSKAKVSPPERPPKETD